MQALKPCSVHSLLSCDKHGRVISSADVRPVQIHVCGKVCKTWRNSNSSPPFLSLFPTPFLSSFLSVSVSGRLASPCGRSPRGVRLRTPGWKTVRFMITWDKETVSNSLQTVWTACECPHSSQNTQSRVFYFMKYLFFYKAIKCRSYKLLYKALRLYLNVWNTASDSCSIPLTVLQRFLYNFLIIS